MANMGLSVIEMTEGRKYNTADLGRCRFTKCACCGKPISAHTWAVAVHDPSRNTTGYKRVVGIGCKPDTADAPKECDTVALKWRTARDNPAELRASLMRATEKYPGRDVNIHAGYVTVTLYKPENDGCQRLGKLAYTISQYDKDMKMSINGGEWEPFDSEKITNELGSTLGYRGNHAYGI